MIIKQPCNRKVRDSFAMAFTGPKSVRSFRETAPRAQTQAARSGVERTTSTDICYNFRFMLNSEKFFTVSDLRHFRANKKKLTRKISKEITPKF